MISNSSPLIFLAKINQLQLLKKLFRNIIIPSNVEKEILIGDKPDSKSLFQAIKENWIKIENPKKEINLEIGKGEGSAINLAREKNDTLIIDDALGNKIANSFNIKTIRTTTIILMAVKSNFISKKEAIQLINKLIGLGYYISPKYYTSLLMKLRG